MFYDVHCHLDLIKNEKELRTTIKEALTAGVEQMISCSTTFASNQHNLNLQKSFPNVKAGIGLYPLDAMELNEEELKRAFGFFKTHAKEAIAIGEVGLDYKFAKSEEQRKKQEEVFRQFIMLSNETKKPLIIHSRFAQSQVIEILVQEKAQKVLLHSFVDSEKLMKKVTEQGFFISVGLSILSNEQTQKNVQGFPLENLLFETDSPIRFNGEKACSKQIIQIAQKVAELKNISLEEIEKQLEQNFITLFG